MSERANGREGNGWERRDGLQGFTLTLAEHVLAMPTQGLQTGPEGLFGRGDDVPASEGRQVTGEVMLRCQLRRGDDAIAR
jgi:hypothetical protein